MANPVTVTAPHRLQDMGGQVLDNVGGIQDVNGVPVAGAVQQATIADLAVTDGTLAVTDGTLAVTDVDALAGIVKVVTTEVDASAQGTGQTTAIHTVPAHCLILAVIAKVTESFDGDTTTTFEVGITANPDQFIDTADFEPETLGLTVSNVESTTADVNGMSTTGTGTLAIEALWTNTGNGVAGKVDVTVVYIELADFLLGTELATAFGEVETSVNTDIPVSFAEVEVSINTDLAASFAEIETKVNAILVALEDAGILADA